MKNCPLGSLRFMIFKAVGLMSAAVSAVPNAELARPARLAASRLESLRPGSTLVSEIELSSSETRWP